MDFIITDKIKNTIKEAVHVCLTVNDENLRKVFNDLLKTMHDLEIEKGNIVTLNQKDTFEKQERSSKRFLNTLFSTH